MKTMVRMLFFVGVFGVVLGAAPIDLQLGCRPQALGGAFVALSDDVNAVSWNPAGLPRVAGKQLMFMHALYGDLAGVSLDNIGYVQPAGTGGFGLSWSMLGCRLEQGTDDQSSWMGESSYVLAYGVPAGKKLSFGMRLKRLVIESSIGDGAGLALDAGSMWTLAKNRVTFGFLIRNIAADFKNESCAWEYRAGVAVRMLRNAVRFALDVDAKRDIADVAGVGYKVHSGLEYSWHEVVALRMGYDAGALTGGFGVHHRGLGLEYTYSVSAALGAQHRVATVIQFARLRPAPATVKSIK